MGKLDLEKAMSPAYWRRREQGATWWMWFFFILLLGGCLWPWPLLALLPKNEWAGMFACGGGPLAFFIGFIGLFLMAGDQERHARSALLVEAVAPLGLVGSWLPPMKQLPWLFTSRICKVLVTKQYPPEWVFEGKQNDVSFRVVVTQCAVVFCGFDLVPDVPPFLLIDRKQFESLGPPFPANILPDVLGYERLLVAYDRKAAMWFLTEEFLELIPPEPEAVPEVADGHLFLCFRKWIEPKDYLKVVEQLLVIADQLQLSAEE
jgi:hypothetical protein